jgi:hypothetical protein
MLRRVALVRTDVPEDRIDSFTSKKRAFFIGTAVKTSNLTPKKLRLENQISHNEFVEIMQHQSV